MTIVLVTGMDYHQVEISAPKTPEITKLVRPFPLCVLRCLPNLKELLSSKAVKDSSVSERYVVWHTAARTK